MDSEVKVVTKVGRERFACHVEDKKLYSWAKLEQSIFFLFLINLFIDLFFFNLFWCPHLVVIHRYYSFDPFIKVSSSSSSEHNWITLTCSWFMVFNFWTLVIWLGPLGLIFSGGVSSRGIAWWKNTKRLEQLLGTGKLYHIIPCRTFRYLSSLNLASMQLSNCHFKWWWRLLQLWNVWIFQTFLNWTKSLFSTSRNFWWNYSISQFLAMHSS